MAGTVMLLGGVSCRGDRGKEFKSGAMMAREKRIFGLFFLGILDLWFAWT
jgi:hypothetical protein